MLQLSKKLRYKSKFIRYGIGGGIAALIDLFFLWFFIEITHLFYLLAQVCAFIISFTFGFYFQKYLTFRDFSGRHMRQGFVFLLFQICGLIINLLILKFMVEYAGIHYLLGSVIAKGIVFLRNYIMNHYFNFSVKAGN